MLFLAACSCERSSLRTAVPDSRPPVDSTANGMVDSMAWLAAHREIDFTGDGVVDTVRLQAVGRDTDSLQIALTFWSGGTERWREVWASGYELMVPRPPADSAARAAYLRARLDRVLAGVEVEPFDSAAYVTLAAPLDSAVLRRPPSRQVSVAYGYETTVVLAWDSVSGRLRRLHACC